MLCWKESLQCRIVNCEDRYEFTCCDGRFGRLTVVALESKLESREKEVQQLTRALEKSDEHISGLESELQRYLGRQESTVDGPPPADDQPRDTVGPATLGSSSDDTDCSYRKKLKFTTGSDNWRASMILTLVPAISCVCFRVLTISKCCCTLMIVITKVYRSIKHAALTDAKCGPEAHKNWLHMSLAKENYRSCCLVYIIISHCWACLPSLLSLGSFSLAFQQPISSSTKCPYPILVGLLMMLYSHLIVGHPEYIVGWLVKVHKCVFCYFEIFQFESLRTC